MSIPLRLLLVEDNEDDAQLILHELRHNGYEVEFERVETAEKMLLALTRQDWDLILCDYSLPKFSAPQALIVMQTSGLDLPFIIISGTIGEDTAVASLKAGAHDFMIKGNLIRLVPAIQRELQDVRTRHENHQREREVKAIASISMTLRKAKTLDETLSLLLDRTIELIDAEIGSIWMYDIASDQVNQSIQRGSMGENIDTSFQRGKGIPGWVVKSGVEIISREFSADPRVQEKNRNSIPKGIGGACIPLFSDENIVGVMIINVKLPPEISNGELRVLKALAEIGGNAIHRMHLLEQSLKQLDRLRSLRTIDIAISRSLDLQLSLQTVLEEVVTQLKVDAACVLLVNPDTKRLEFRAGLGFRTYEIKSTSLKIGEGFAGQVALGKKIVYIKDFTKPDSGLPRLEVMKCEGFTTYFGTPLITKEKVEGVLEIFNRSPLHIDNEWLGFIDSLSWQTAIAVENALLFENLNRSNSDLASAYDATIEGWSRALDLRDKETEGHSLRVMELTLKLARLIGLDEDLLVNVRRGTLLHDIGKMGVPDVILFKPGQLNEEEWIIMHQHPQYAYDLLSPISYLKQALDIPYCHHEKWDGTGYPRKLKGMEIPLAARIFALIDVWDALTNERPYRSAWAHSKATEYIRRNSGTHFDPQLTEKFLENILDMQISPQGNGG